MTPNTASLLADVGGTNTRVALSEGGRLLPETIRKYRNEGQPSLAGVLATYLAEMGNPDCTGACVAVAGPVQGGVGRLTNLDWSLSEAELAEASQAETAVILNDLQAQGHALGALPDAALHPVLPGSPQPHAPRLVIGVGTGFNAAVVHELGAGRLVTASECGHVTLPCRTAQDLDLVRFLEAAHGFAGVEDALSGRGLERLHSFLTGQERSSAEIMAALAAGEADETGRLFVRLLGAVAGDLALIHLPFGGIWLIGGLARALEPYYARFGFAAAFRDKGRFSSFLDGLPLGLIADDFAALTGCARHLARLGA